MAVNRQAPVPTFERLRAFLADYRRLTPEERLQFMAAVEAFIAALTTWEDNGKRDRPNFPARLRVKPVAGQSGVWEMTWQLPSGRATFEFGPPVVDDKVHVIWRRVGGHEILREP